MMDKDINCINYKGLFGYIETRFGRKALTQFFETAVNGRTYLIANKNDPAQMEPVTLDHLVDESYWISNELSLCLLKTIKTIVPGPHPEQTAGQGAVLENLSNRDLFFSRVIGPNALAKKAARVNAKFNQTKDVVVSNLQKDSCTIQMHYKPGFKVTKEVCNWNLGIYKGLATASGVRLTRVRQAKCVLDGDDYCAFELAWQAPGFFKRISTLVLRFFAKDLVAEYEKTVKDRDRLIENLSASEYQYRLLIENQSDMVVKLDTQGRFQFVSPSYCRMFNTTSNQLMGKNFMQYVHEADQPDTARELQTIYEPPYTRRIEQRAMTKQGLKWFSWVGTAVFDDDKNVTAIIGVGRDITKQRQAQAEKIQAHAQAAEARKLALIGQVAGKMAHDFNNILGIIMGTAELSRRDHKGGATKDAFDLIFEQTLRGKNLTKNLVAFAKDQELKPEYFSINQKIKNVLELMEKELKDIHVVREYDQNLPDLLADPGMIEHMLINILLNSAHATGLVQEPEISIRTIRSQDQVDIEIVDNGCGIPEKHLDDIFEPAFSLKGNKDKSGLYPGIKGTGYGLANVKKYVDQHKGHISVLSGDSEGTRMTVGLPIIQKQPAKKEMPAIADAGAAGACSEKYILLVEDEPAISAVQHKILTQKPYCHKVDIAGSGRTAMDLFETNTYDLISLDYMLPGGLNGMDVYHHIRKTNTTIPILFISGNIEFLESIKQLRKKDPFIDHLSKPCMHMDYIAAVNSLAAQAQICN